MFLAWIAPFPAPRKKTQVEREHIFPAVFPKILGKNLSIKKLNGDLTNKPIQHAFWKKMRTKQVQNRLALPGKQPFRNLIPINFTHKKSHNCQKNGTLLFPGSSKNN